MDHTSESPVGTAADAALSQRFATPTFGNSETDDGSNAPSEQQRDNVDSGSLHDAVPVTEKETDAIEFRVFRPGAPVRRLRLTGNRYTFGSAEGCSIRLDDQSLRPMHAVLIRDASRILVRAYSVPIEINGTRTTEATLRVGDILRLGAYQFELLAESITQANSPIDSG